MVAGRSAGRQKETRQSGPSFAGSWWRARKQVQAAMHIELTSVPHSCFSALAEMERRRWQQQQANRQLRSAGWQQPAAGSEPPPSCPPAHLCLSNRSSRDPTACAPLDSPTPQFCGLVTNASAGGTCTSRQNCKATVAKPTACIEEQLMFKLPVETISCRRRAGEGVRRG